MRDRQARGNDPYRSGDALDASDVSTTRDARTGSTMEFNNRHKDWDGYNFSHTALPVDPLPEDDWFEPTGKKGREAKQSMKDAHADFTAVEEISTSEPAQAPEESRANAGDQAVLRQTESPAELSDNAKPIKALRRCARRAQISTHLYAVERGAPAIGPREHGARRQRQGRSTHGAPRTVTGTLKGYDPLMNLVLSMVPSSDLDTTYRACGFL